MSLILDALKRAERERQAAHSPILTDPSLPGPSRRGGLPWLRWAAIMLLLAVLGGGAAWWLDRKPAAPEPVAATPAPAPRVTPQPASQAAPPPVVTAPPAAATPAPPVIPGTESVATLDDLGVEPEPLVSSEPVEIEDVQPQDDAATTPPPTTVQARPPAPSAPSTEPPAVPPRAVAPAPKPSAQPSPPVPAALTQPAPPRKLREMPPEYRADFPALSVDVHVYERDAARRFVMINGKRYKEGERLAEGPAIVAIDSDGIVFDYRGQKVLYTLSR